VTVSIDTSTEELARLQSRLTAVLEVATKPQLILMQLAKGVIAQTVQRIEVDKESPAGQPWAPWSTAYAATRDEGDSLLIDSRDLVDSFEFKVTRNSFAVWTDVEYAGVHQFGGGNNIPARPFLGVSSDNAENIGEWLQGILLNSSRGAKIRQTTRGKKRK
jgi:phage virion morphogenesis protein